MGHPTWSIEVMEVTGNVIDYTVHMCTIQAKCFGEEKESTSRSATAGCAGSHRLGAPLPGRLLPWTEQEAGRAGRCAAACGRRLGLKWSKRYAARPLTELGQDLLGVELEKTCLIRPDLVDPDVRITCLGCLRDCRNVTCGIRTTDNRLRDLLRPPCQRRRMSATASSSMARRVAPGGQ